MIFSNYFVNLPFVCTHWNICSETLLYTHRVGGNRKANTIEERRSKLFINRVFDCHLLPYWRQLPIENTVFIDFYLRSSIVDSIFDCRLPSVVQVLMKIGNFF